MNLKTLIGKTENAEPKIGHLQSLDALLIELTQYGEPHLSFHGSLLSGWHTAIDLNTGMPGMKSRISSDSGHESPLASVLECHDRLIRLLGLR